MHLGDCRPGDTIDFDFTTSQNGVPATLGGTPVVSIYKDNSTVESIVGVTLTVDHDARTGKQHVRVTTASDGTFYASGSEFIAVITTGTVGGLSVVGTVVAAFSLEKRSALRPATAGRQLVVDASGRIDLGSWLGAAPAALTANGYLQAIVLRWLTDNAGGTPNALITNRVDANAQVVGDKTGYALTQTFPANFSSLSIDATGNIKIQGNIKKNAVFAGFPFLMTDSINHAPAIGKTVLVTRSLDGGSFASGTLSSVVEVGSGMYKVDFAAADLNANSIVLRAVASGCDDTLERIITFI